MTHTLSYLYSLNSSTQDTRLKILYPRIHYFLGLVLSLISRLLLLDFLWFDWRSVSSAALGRCIRWGLPLSYLKYCLSIDEDYFFPQVEFNPFMKYLAKACLFDNIDAKHTFISNMYFEYSGLALLISDLSICWFTSINLNNKRYWSGPFSLKKYEKDSPSVVR